MSEGNAFSISMNTEILVLSWPPPAPKKKFNKANSKFVYIFSQ